MKKKLLICIQNSYVLNQYEDDFRELSNKFDITLIIVLNQHQKFNYGLSMVEQYSRRKPLLEVA